MVLKKFEEQYRDEYIKMSLEFFNSGAVLSSVNKENFHKTFDEILSNSPLVTGYIIFFDNKICGYLSLAFSWNNDLGGTILWIEEIFIKKEYRSLGLGKKIMQEIEILYKNKVKALRLEVSEENNTATKLYEKIGYKKRNYMQYYKEI